MLQGFTSSDTKQNLHLQSVTRASFLHSGSIFFWRPLHHSARSRGWALCLNTFFVFASVAGGYWRAFGSSGFAHLSSIALKHAVRVRFGFGSSGSSLAFQSSLFRGLFFGRFGIVWMRSMTADQISDISLYQFNDNHKTKDVSKDRLAHTYYPQRQARSCPTGFQKNLHPPLSGSIF